MILFASKAGTTFSCKFDLSFNLLLFPTCSCQIRGETRYELSDIWMCSGLLKSSKKIRWMNSRHYFLVFCCYYLFFNVLWKCCNENEFFVALTVVCSLSSVLSVVPLERIGDHWFFIALIDFKSVSIWLFGLLDLCYSHLLCPNEPFLVIFVVVCLSFFCLSFSLK